MDNKLLIEYRDGAYRWQVLTAGDVLLCSGSAGDVLSAAAEAINWMGGRCQ